MIARIRKSVRRRFEDKLFSLSDRCVFPGFQRVYCPDPNFDWLGFQQRRLRSAALFRGVQLRLPRFNEPSEHASAAESELRQLGIEASWIDKIIEYPLALYFEVQLHELQNLERLDGDIIELHRAKAAEVLLEQYKQIKAFKPHLILIAQGYGHHGTAARLLAAHFDIPVLAFENTAIDNRLVWEPVSGITVNHNIAANMFWRYADVIPEKEAEGFCNGIIAKTKEVKKLEHASPDTQWAGQTDRPMILFLGQVYTDSSILYGSYPGLGPENVVAHLADYCKRHGFDLVIKLHPKEASDVPVPGTQRKYNRLTLRKLKKQPRRSPRQPRQPKKPLLS